MGDRNFVRKYPCTSQRLYCNQKSCKRPCNDGDTAISAYDEQARDFDNIFDPFSKTYKSKNFVCRPLATRISIPISSKGSGAQGQVRCSRRGKGCKCGKSRCGKGCQCNTGCVQNDNNNAISQFEAAERCFEQRFSNLLENTCK